MFRIQSFLFSFSNDRMLFLAVEKEIILLEKIMTRFCSKGEWAINTDNLENLTLTYTISLKMLPFPKS